MIRLFKPTAGAGCTSVRAEVDEVDCIAIFLLTSICLPHFRIFGDVSVVEFDTSVG